ncbi:unnamed protein product, partial [marine sediment metagenome]
ANCLSWNGGQEGVFTHKIKNFLAGTTYNVRAFAKNKRGTGYAESPEELKSFTTLSPAQVPKLASTGIGEVTQRTAVFQGAIQNHGGAQIDPDYGYGFCWSKVNAMPTPEDPPDEVACENLGGVTIDVDKDGIDFDFTFTATGLSMGRDYYVRAFAQNEISYGYGDSNEFTTKPPGPPSVETYQVDPATIIGRTAEAGGKITDDGGDYEGTFGGICYSYLDPDPTYPPRYDDPDCTVGRDGQGIGTFTSQMTELHGGYTYYYRAYAHNPAPAGTAYGNQYSFVAGSDPGEECIGEDAECRLCGQPAEAPCPGYCVDGVCCDNACDESIGKGTCWACNIENHKGECTVAEDVAEEGTDPRDQCDENWFECVGSCVKRGYPGYCGDRTGKCSSIVTKNIAEGFVCTGDGEETLG